MHNAEHFITIIFLLVHVLPANFKDLKNTTKMYTKQKTSSVDLYVSYSHNPWGESRQLRRSYNKPSRSKRSVLQLYNMVVCATGCDPLAYKGYGCYCGFLGSGYPVDPIDSCCKMHDWCYDTATCPMFLEYFIPYVWSCYMGQPVCTVGSTCSQRLCECDRQLAECLRRYSCPISKAVCSSSPWRWFQNVLMIR